MRSIAFLVLVLAVLLIGIVVAIENQPQRAIQETTNAN